MNNIEFRTLLASLLTEYHAFYGDNVGEFDENLGYKINYKESSVDSTERQVTYTLDLDIWSKDSEIKEIVCNQLECLFNYQSYNLNGKWGTFINVNRYNADEKEVYRTTLTFEVRTW